MSFWILLRNAGTIISLLRGIGDAVGEVSKTKKAPPAAMMQKIFDDCEALLDSGAIDVPGVDEAAISEALKQIEAFVCRPK